MLRPLPAVGPSITSWVTEPLSLTAAVIVNGRVIMCNGIVRKIKSITRFTSPLIWLCNQMVIFKAGQPPNPFVEIIALPCFPFLASIFLRIMSLFIVLLNRWDVRAVLNEVLDWRCSISRGKEFQTEGAEEWCANLLFFMCGICRAIEAEEERICLRGEYT